MKDIEWQNDLYSFLVDYGIENRIHPEEMMYFLMSFCASFMQSSSDEEDVRVFTKVFHDIAMEIINNKKKLRVHND